MISRRLRGPGAVAGLASLLWALGPAGAGTAATPAAAASAALPAVALPAVSPTAAPPAFSLRVSPTRFAITGDELTAPHSFKVTNGGSQPLDLTVRKSDFTTTRAGAMVLAPAAPYSAVNWISTNVTRFTLAPGQAQTVTFQITKPTGPEPGDHQAALVFLVPAGNQGPNIRLNRGIGTPIYITIPGPINSTTTITKLHAPGFAVRGPITLTATVTDTGDVHRDFRGRTALTADAHGGRVAFPDFTILRDTTRDVATTWRRPPLFCVCHATVSVPGAGGTVSERTVRIVVVPLAWIALVLVGLAGLGVLVWYLPRRRRARLEPPGRHYA